MIRKHEQKIVKDKNVRESFHNKGAQFESGVLTVFPSERLNDSCDRFVLITEEEWTGNDSTLFFHEKSATIDKLFEDNSVTPTQGKYFK